MTDGLPLLVSSVDLTKLALTVDEAFVATRLDGRTTVDAVAAMVGKDAGTVSRIVRKLADLGAVTFQAQAAARPSARSTLAPPPGRPSMSAPARSSVIPVEAPKKPSAPPIRPAAPIAPYASSITTPTASVAPPAPGTKPGPFVPAGDGPHDYGAFVFPSGQLAEPSDLDVEAKKRILYWTNQMDAWSHYQLLGVDRKADAKTIKTAYFDRSKDWHPDRFKRFKSLGVFGKMVESIYKRVSMAYKILGDDAARADYDKALPRDLDATDIEALLLEQIQAERDQRREEERHQRRLKQNPVLARFARAKEFYDQAVELEKAGKLAEAMRAAQMATTYDDRKVEFRALFERLRDLAGDERIIPYIRRGRHFETMADWEEALGFYEEAVRIAPHNGECRVRYAYTLLHAGRPIEEVMPHAQKALQLAGEDAESHYVLARCYEDRGNEKGAKRHYERALELRPGFAEAQKRLKRLKWGF